MNLLQETLQDIEKSGHTPDDIKFIGSKGSGYSCTWEQFKTLADQEYDSGFGSAEVATDLIIVFTDGAQMWRGEYDGSEWWVYAEPFKMPATLKPVSRLFITNRVGGDSLETINQAQP